MFLFIMAKKKKMINYLKNKGNNGQRVINENQGILVARGLIILRKIKKIKQN
jgi:hypothetical protein